MITAATYFAHVLDSGQKDTAMRLAIADDDNELRLHLSDLVRSAGHDCDEFSNGTECMTALGRDTYDAALLDWNMPGATGIEIIKWASETLPSPPAMILVTGRSETGEIVRGLEAGAADYIVKPESDAVILARIDAATRKLAAERKPDETESYGGFSLHNSLEQVTLDGEPIKLTSKEFQLARLLFRNLNRPLSRSYIFTHIWGILPDTETRTLDMHVSRVRTKLGLRPQNGYSIQTVFGFGYRMDQHEQAGAEG